MQKCLSSYSSIGERERERERVAVLTWISDYSNNRVCSNGRFLTRSKESEKKRGDVLECVQPFKRKSFVVVVSRADAHTLVARK